VHVRVHVHAYIVLLRGWPMMTVSLVFCVLIDGWIDGWIDFSVDGGWASVCVGGGGMVAVAC